MMMRMFSRRTMEMMTRSVSLFIVFVAVMVVTIVIIIIIIS